MMSFEDVKCFLKQRFPIIMVDRVLELEAPSRIKTIKCIAGNEIYFSGHFPDFSIMPGVLIIEAMAQSASILFSKSTGKGMDSKSLMVLGAVNDIRFLAPALPGYNMVINVNVVKLVDDAAIVEGNVFIEDNLIAKGRLTFARKII